MKEIREQILKILIDKIKCSGYTAIEGIPQSAREIESLIKKKCRDKYNKGFADGQRAESNFLNRTNI